MDKLLFVAHDPGGSDVIVPTYEYVAEKTDGKVEVKLFLLGPSGSRIDRYASGKEEVVRAMEDAAVSHGRTLVVTGTSWGVSYENEILAYARELGIKTVSVLDYWSNYKKRFALKDGFVFPDTLFVMDELAKEEAIKDGIDPSLIQIVGQPGLDKYVSLKANHTPDNKKILFLSQPLSLLYGRELGYTEEDVLEDIFSLAQKNDLECYVKFHPKDREDWKGKFRDCTVDTNLEDCVSEYGTIIGMSTMGLLQCRLMGGNVLSYQPGLVKEDLCITNKLGITDGIFSYEELEKQLLQGVANQEKGQYYLWMDGNSTKRCGDRVLQLLAGGKGE
ncbi:MAG: alpha-2,8-polysialyltransferase family protein [Lachnospiraceae bacterium]|nr:alpha-2,8-polysialyltransferase family protein [Lachnospiraceae bacterium]